MRTISLPKTSVVILPVFALLGVVPVAADPPTAVSPGGESAAMIQSRCPTFSWSEAKAAAEYELALYRVQEIAARDSAAEPVAPKTAETELVTRIRLPAGTTAWTPSMSQCLERGGRYAWSIRAMNGAEPGAWSEASLFRVTGTPSATDVKAAIETLKRYLEEKGTAEVDRGVSQRVGPEATRTETRRDPVDSIQRSERWSKSSQTKNGLSAAALESETASASVTAPSLESPSLTVDGDIALGQDSNLFKRGDVLLWDDYLGNLALGVRALSSVSADGFLGIGLQNTAIGRNALVDNTEGSSNIAVGDGTLKYVTTGSNNIAIGEGAGEDLGEGTAAVGNDNIFIGHPGMPTDSGVIRIGESGTHYTTSIAGAEVGLGLYGDAPTTRLHVQGTKSGPATENNHVVFIENLLGSGSAGCLGAQDP